MEMTARELKTGVISNYDDIAGEYAEEFFGDTSVNNYINQFLESLDGTKVLDAGCGNGSDCKYMIERGFDVKGVDLSQGMLTIARQKVPYGNFEVMDMTDLTEPDNSYDGIISNCSLFHIPLEELPKTLNSWRRVLKQNGKLLLILQEGNGEEMVEEPYRPGVFIYINRFSKERIKELLNEHDFTVDFIETQNTDNEFELGDGKLIVIATNKKNKTMSESGNTNLTKCL